MPPDPARKLADLVQQAGRLHSLPEHSRAERESELFGEVRLGLLQPEALESSFEEHDMAAMLRLMVSCGRKKRLASRAVENLKQFLNSRPWLKVAHGSPELLGELKAFLLENPEVTKDTDMTAVASLLEAPPSDSKRRPDSPTTPAKLDEEPRRMILEPLQRGRELMATCRWQVVGDESGEALSLFCRGVARLAGTAVGREAMEAPGAELPVLDWLASDWPNIIKFLANVHELKRLNRSQVEACVEKLRCLSRKFSEAEATTEGLPWRLKHADSDPEDAKDEVLSDEAEKAEEPPPPPPPLPPPTEEEREKPGLFKRFFGGKAEEPLAPPPAPVAVPTPTVIVPKVAPGPAGGYPSGPSGAAARAPKAAAKPGVVWVDSNPKAWQQTVLNGHAGVSFKGFDGSQDAQPWLSYVKQRAASEERVAVVILNRRHKNDAVAIKQFCAGQRVRPPKFIVCGRASPEEVCREWGMQDIHVTKDWDEATRIALSEVRTPCPAPRHGHAAGIDM